MKTFQALLDHAGNFELRRTIERLREGLFDPFGVRLMTSGEEKLNHFSPQTKVNGFYPIFAFTPDFETFEQLRPKSYRFLQKWKK